MFRLGSLLVFAAALAFGQGRTATISGTVTDSSGSAIAGAKVTAINVDTNVSREQSSQADGAYSLLFLPIGTYRIEISDGVIADRRQIEPEDTCTGESYEPI